MTDPKEIPQQVADLIELAKQYLRQETVDPLKRLGKSVAIAAMVAVLVGLGAVLGSLALHRFLRDAFPDTNWWGVAPAGITAVVFLAAAALVVGRVGKGHG